MPLLFTHHRTHSKQAEGPLGLAVKLFALGDDLLMGAAQGLWDRCQEKCHSLAEGRVEVARRI